MSIYLDQNGSYQAKDVDGDYLYNDLLLLYAQIMNSWLNLAAEAGFGMFPAIVGLHAQVRAAMALR